MQASTTRRGCSGTLVLSAAQNDRVCHALRTMWVASGSQARLAEELQVSQQTISGVLVRRRATPGFAAVLARKLGVPFEELIGPRK